MSGSAPPALAEHEIHLWSFSLGDPPRGRRRERARAHRAEILASYLGITPAEIALIETDGGKPALAGGELEFNLAHCGTLAVLAVSRSLPVGVDLEGPRDTIDLDRGIRDRCTQREGASVRAAADPHAEWVRLWARKEAVVKATGEGVLDQLGSIDVLGELVLRTDGPAQTAWRCLDLEPPVPGYHLALAMPAVDGLRVVRLQG